MKKFIYVFMLIPFVLLAKQPEAGDVWLFQTSNPFKPIKYYQFILEVKPDRLGNNWCRLLYRKEGEKEIVKREDTAWSISVTSDFLRKATYQDSSYFKLN